MNGHVTTIGALGVIIELVENIRPIQFHYTFQGVIFVAIAAIDEKFVMLVGGQLVPILAFDDFVSHLRQLLDDEGVLFSNGILAHHGHFFERPQHLAEHWQLIEQRLVDVLSQSQKIRFSESRDLIFSVCFSAHEHVVDGEPDLALSFRQLVRFRFRYHLPFLVFEFLHFTSHIQSQPWFQF